MLVKSSNIYLKIDLKYMKVNQTAVLSPTLLAESTQLGQRIARLRTARRMKQFEAALRAGLSRNTAYRIEHGDPGVAMGQILRYLDAIAPGCNLQQLLNESDPALISQHLRERTQRVRGMTAAELKELEF
jgi:transcriptional regulator with XRE-family HTH domain